MAVYTKLTFEEIADFLKNYSIGDLLSFREIIDGIDNSNFVITTSHNQQYILTIFEKRIDPEHLPFFMNLKLHLAKKNICCPRPIADNSGALISSVKGRSASIVTFLFGATLKPRADGYYDNITVRHCYEVGEVLAQLHGAVEDFEETRINDLGILGWRSLLNKMQDLVDEFQPGLKKEITAYIDFLEKNWNSDLPGGVLHLDLFPDNVFFDAAGNLTGIIDFYFSANDLFIYDLAIIVNSWCFDENNKFRQDRFDAVCKGYEKIRGFAQKETDFLNIALMGAALRFLLTRLYDYFFTKKDSIVNIKDPNEYLQKTRFFGDRLKV